MFKAVFICLLLFGTGSFCVGLNTIITGRYAINRPYVSGDYVAIGSGTAYWSSSQSATASLFRFYKSAYSGWYFIRSEYSGNVLHANSNGSVSTGSADSGNSYRLWKLQRRSDGYYYIINRALNMAFDGNGGGGTGFYIWEVNETNHQVWRLQKIDGSNRPSIYSDNNIGCGTGKFYNIAKDDCIRKTSKCK
eukprot:TRINITY_DN734_c0_g1_i3.p1 TRINITY_DN734_c0_g1~~TRINITY_DN734_c0_g1_i3.p1  ORF type:complete len:192 (+),score=20.86 TRINITY_DN734_c0_g1_i3:77-652(+)